MWESTKNKTFNLKKLDAEYTILYFYPKDNTPGCTREGLDFKKLYKKFLNLGADIFGVSRDSLKSHENFSEKMKCPFSLISDPEEILCKKFDVIKEKNMYGRKVMGIERSTFILDKKGKVIKEWRKIKVPGHAEEVLSSLKEILE
ncbi:MAG: peroxiredoxin [Oligoflexia bacterium]|nr:peroxiredoxin [Oligoflexia bacterium]